MLHGAAFGIWVRYLGVKVRENECSIKVTSLLSGTLSSKVLLIMVCSIFRWRRAHIVACLSTSPNAKPEINPSNPCHMPSGALPFKDTNSS